MAARATALKGGTNEGISTETNFPESVRESQLCSHGRLSDHHLKLFLRAFAEHSLGSRDVVGGASGPGGAIGEREMNRPSTNKDLRTVIRRIPERDQGHRDREGRKLALRGHPSDHPSNCRDKSQSGPAGSAESSRG